MSVAGDDTEFAEWLTRPVEERALDVLGHVMMNLRDLSEWAADTSQLQNSSLTFPVYVACVEAFFTNARLAAEFFWKMPRGDITARTFVSDWRPPRGIAQRMERVWLMASRHIVHLSRDRVPTSPDDWQQEDMSYRALARIARDASTALGHFTDAYERQSGPYVDQLRDMRQGTRLFTQKELAALRQGKPKPRPVVIQWW